VGRPGALKAELPAPPKKALAIDPEAAADLHETMGIRPAQMQHERPRMHVELGSGIAERQRQRPDALWRVAPPAPRRRRTPIAGALPSMLRHHNHPASRSRDNLTN